eukprot:TRINITY_DN14389_c0_g1_i1.p1 TRINITY_DN14389_c0_g1~~TRINITY_DN14389_c0_g1_i1.p1  ORF type:complete len:307 (-),score=111.74 TRINITY_DN14389_c0_g1_i1:221-1141(-)
MKHFSVLVVVLFLVCLFATETKQEDYVPVVLWHGMGDICCDPLSMGRIKRLIEKHLPGVYVYSVEVGSNIIEDEINGFFGNVNDQIGQIASKFRSDNNLSRGFNAVGFSQGGQFLRGYVEQYMSPQVFNLITMGGQHQGVYGFPNTCDQDDVLCEATRRLLDLGAYLDIVQEVSVQAQYWQDPLNEEKYREKNRFLPIINNDGHYNATYKENMLKLKNFVMVKFLNDTVVIPRESEWFGFYAPGQDKIIIPLEETNIFINDTIGLKELSTNGKLAKLSTLGNHLQFTDEYFVNNIIYPYLNVTFTS